MLERQAIRNSNLEDTLMMEFIYERWSGAIARNCRSSSVPAEFLAALVANESGGEPEKKRFRRDIYEQILCVRDGKAVHSLEVLPSHLRTLTEEQLVECATSWGLTQMMGYYVLPYGSRPHLLLSPEFNLNSALQRLAVFSEQCLLDLRSEFEDMFRCWATGRPDGIPADRSYVEIGMCRLALYREILNSGINPNRMAA